MYSEWTFIKWKVWIWPELKKGHQINLNICNKSGQAMLKCHDMSINGYNIQLSGVSKDGANDSLN